MENNHPLISELLRLNEDSKKDAYVATTFGKKLMDAAKSQESPAPKTVEELITSLNAADPQKGKNIVWIARMYAQRLFKLEDCEKINAELVKFASLTKFLVTKDLNSFKNLNSFYDAVEAAEALRGDAPVEKSAKEKVADVKENDVEWIIKTPHYKALIPKTEEASNIYGAGTKWCTASTNMKNYFKEYTAQGDLVIIIATIDGEQRKFQFHYKKGEFANERDQEATNDEIVGLSAHPEHVDLLMELIDRHVS